MNRNEVMNVLNFRHACKEFDKENKISKEDVEVILEAGRLSPSSLGIEPWKFIVIENQELKDELGAVCWGGKTQMPTCSHLIVVLSRRAKELRYDSSYINYILKDVKKLPEESALKFKSLMKTLEEERYKDDNDIEAYASNQVYIAVGNMMTAAAMLRIDSCAIGGIDKNSVEKMLIDRGILDTEKFNISLCLAFGYRVKEAGEKLRQEMSEVITWVK